jgi:hypothetical protein
MVKTTKINYTLSSQDLEDNTGELLTKPNGSQSIREILFRNTQGMTYDNYKTPFYEDQATFSSKSLNEIQNMDITDKMSFLTNLSKETNALKKKISDYKKEQDSIAQAKATELANSIAKQEETFKDEK